MHQCCILVLLTTANISYHKTGCFSHKTTIGVAAMQLSGLSRIVLSLLINSSLQNGVTPFKNGTNTLNLTVPVRG